MATHHVHFDPTDEILYNEARIHDGRGCNITPLPQPMKITHRQRDTSGGYIDNLISSNQSVIHPTYELPSRYYYDARNADIFEPTYLITRENHTGSPDPFSLTTHRDVTYDMTGDTLYKPTAYHDGSLQRTDADTELGRIIRLSKYDGPWSASDSDPICTAPSSTMLKAMNVSPKSVAFMSDTGYSYFDIRTQYRRIVSIIKHDLADLLRHISNYILVFFKELDSDIWTCAMDDTLQNKIIDVIGHETPNNETMNAIYLVDNLLDDKYTPFIKTQQLKDLHIFGVEFMNIYTLYVMEFLCIAIAYHEANGTVTKDYQIYREYLHSSKNTNDNILDIMTHIMDITL